MSTYRFNLILAILCLLIAGCSSQPSYEDAFSSHHQVQGSVESLPASVDIAWGSVLEVLAQQGFLVQQADAKSHIILANREIRDTKDQDMSYTVSATLTFVPIAEQITRVLVAANQTTEMHKKEYRWWKLLWLVPIFPTGSDYTTVVVNRDTVRSPQFYRDFFSAAKRSCEEKNAVTTRVPVTQ
jgi:hypothetical protein